MFSRSPIVVKLDEEINTQLDKLATLRDDPEKYGAAVDRIAKLQKMKSDEQTKLPSLDTALVVGANIFGILWLARYERENVIKSPSAFRTMIKPHI